MSFEPDSCFLFELLCEVCHEAAVEIFAAKSRVAVGGQDLEHAIVKGE